MAACVAGTGREILNPGVVILVPVTLAMDGSQMENGENGLGTGCANVAWCSDIHLEFANESRRARFYHQIKDGAMTLEGRNPRKVSTADRVRGAPGGATAAPRCARSSTGFLGRPSFSR